MWWLIGVDVVAHCCRCGGSLAGRCGGSLVAHQTSGAEVPGSNPASTTWTWCGAGSLWNKVENLKRVERETYPWGKKRSKKKELKWTTWFILKNKKFLNFEEEKWVCSMWNPLFSCKSWHLMHWLQYYNFIDSWCKEYLVLICA